MSTKFSSVQEIQNHINQPEVQATELGIWKAIDTLLLPSTELTENEASFVISVGQNVIKTWGEHASENADQELQRELLEIADLIDRLKPKEA